MCISHKKKKQINIPFCSKVPYFILSLDLSIFFLFLIWSEKGGESLIKKKKDCLPIFDEDTNGNSLCKELCIFQLTNTKYIQALIKLVFFTAKIKNGRGKKKHLKQGTDMIQPRNPLEISLPKLFSLAALTVNSLPNLFSIFGLFLC